MLPLSGSYSKSRKTYGSSSKPRMNIKWPGGSTIPTSANAINSKKSAACFKVKELLLSMEYFEGKTLEDSPTLSLGDVLLVFRMVAGGLYAMHQQGYVHCDIKPNNILLSTTGSIKIIDLGQSCRIGTIKPRIQGTPDYIAPEQVRRKPLGPKTDIFNLGATMYWALTGKNVPTLIPKKNSFGLPIHEVCRAPHEIKKRIPLNISKTGNGLHKGGALQNGRTP